MITATLAEAGGLGERERNIIGTSEGLIVMAVFEERLAFPLKPQASEAPWAVKLSVVEPLEPAR